MLPLIWMVARPSGLTHNFMKFFYFTNRKYVEFGIFWCTDQPYTRNNYVTKCTKPNGLTPLAVWTSGLTHDLRVSPLDRIAVCATDAAVNEG